MVANDAQESEENKSCIVCKVMFKKLLDNYFFIRILILDHKSNKNKNASKA